MSNLSTMTTEIREKKVMDIYDEEFATNLEISKNLIKELSSSKGKLAFLS